MKRRDGALMSPERIISSRRGDGRRWTNNSYFRSRQCQNWLFLSVAALLVIVLVHDFEFVGNLVRTKDFLSSGSTQIKSMFSLDKKDSEHSNQYLCEFLLDNPNRVNGTYDAATFTGNPTNYFDLDCGYDYGASRLGNFLTRWYLTRMIAAKAGVVLSGSCRSASSVFRWMSTDNVDPLDTIALMEEQTGFRGIQNSWQDTCMVCTSNETKTRDMCVFPHGNNNPRIGFSNVIPLIQNDMESLSKGVMNNPDNHLFMVDDIAIHMRVGDIGKISSGRYGLIPFRIYQKYIPKGFNGSIGIITAPFDQSRGRRPNDPTLNEAVVTSAKEYLQQAFSDATVTIRNSPKETHALVFARLLLSKTLLFCAPSSYCLIPALGRSQAVGETIVVQSPLFGPIPGWLGDIKSASSDRNYSFRYVSEPMITSTVLRNLSLPEILSRLQESSEITNNP
ncbi:hypothetical protein IV203_001210 [Nitzschia inconspicua]|uniref:Uncharacterized protein n=1 Tax=Nitzschia inconspicua TaxID=303405 RepID=A0A9K3K836_9STRA|nr:hypothetical protein IV203_002505 [Nitzschia inconspicua]KAG7356524.1 hypothetical protein IV203_001210 [Nitzschia inconspicua]